MALTLIDMNFTALGYQMGFIKEGNPIAAMLFEQDVLATVIGAGIITGVLLLAIALVQRRMNTKWIPTVLWIVAGVKVVIVIMHLFWIFAYALR
jgi:hypothetical protein